MNQIANLNDFIIQQKTFFTGAGGDLESWKKESQFAIQALQKNKVLNDTAQKNRASLQNAIINVAAIGITLNPANKHAYLVPRDGMVCLDISYMGLIHLAVQTGTIEWGQAKIVYENDSYTNIGIDKAPEHRQNTFGDKGSVVGAYCTVKLPNGDYLTEEMDVNKINEIRDKSKAKNGPWKTFYEEMARKSVVKRASKYWPISENLNLAVEALNESEGLQEELLQTSPSTSDYTQDQKHYFDQLIENNDNLGMYLFVSTISEGVYTSLYHSFEKGSKGKYQQIVKSLQEKGRQSFEETKYEVYRALELEYSYELSEALCDCNDQMINMIKDSFTTEQAKIFNEIYSDNIIVRN